MVLPVAIALSLFAARVGHDDPLITNATLRNGPMRPLIVEKAFVFKPSHEWAYNHHPHIAVAAGQLVVIWSNGRVGEDELGQRVLYSTSSDFAHWSTPEVLAEPSRATDVLTAGGLYAGGGGLVAYFSSFTEDYTNTRLFATTTLTGVKWSAPTDIDLPITPNREPTLTSTGRLIMTGNFTFPYTDDPDGLNSWRYTSLAPGLGERQDNRSTFAGVSKHLHLPVNVCEGSFFETDNHQIHMILRSTGPHWDGRLWEATSLDNGETWDRPKETDFSDNDAKFHFGRLPDGRYFYVGNPDPHPHHARRRLVVSLSNDGIHFDRHYLVCDDVYNRQAPGLGKTGQLGYPDVVIDGDKMVIVVSRMKESIEAFRISLDEFDADPAVAAPLKNDRN